MRAVSFCAWSAEYAQEEKICTFYYDIFKRKGELWSRSQEEHKERAHSYEEIKNALSKAGFELIATYGELSDEAPANDEQRIFYVARRMEDGVE